MANLKALGRMSALRFISYLIAVGALAGVAAWCLVYVGSLLLEFSPPVLLSLLLAILRGSLFALIVGYGLRLWWRLRGEDERAEF